MAYVTQPSHLSLADLLHDPFFPMRTATIVEMNYCNATKADGSIIACAKMRTMKSHLRGTLNEVPTPLKPAEGHAARTNNLSKKSGRRGSRKDDTTSWSKSSLTMSAYNQHFFRLSIVPSLTCKYGLL